MSSLLRKIWPSGTSSSSSGNDALILPQSAERLSVLIAVGCFCGGLFAAYAASILRARIAPAPPPAVLEPLSASAPSLRKKKKDRISPHPSRSPVASAADMAHAGAETPEQQMVTDFFSTTKFVGCLDPDEVHALYRLTEVIRLNDNEPLFNVGDSSDSGLFILVAGQLGVYIHDDEGTPQLSNILKPPESLGDFDLLDNGKRCVTVRSLGVSRVLRVSTAVLHTFLRDHPQALLLFLKQTVARMWRIATFTLQDFIRLAVDQPADIVGREEAGKLWEFLQSHPHIGERMTLNEGEELPQPKEGDEEFYVVLSGKLKLTNDGARRPFAGLHHTDNSAIAPPNFAREDSAPTPATFDTATAESSTVFAGPGSLVGGLAFLVGSGSAAQTTKIVAEETSVVIALSLERFETLLLANKKVHRRATSRWISRDMRLADRSKNGGLSHMEQDLRFSEEEQDQCTDAVVDTMFGMGALLSHTVRQFTRLGLQDITMSAGDKLYAEGDRADVMYLVISGRVHVQTAEGGTTLPGQRGTIKYEVGRGQTLGEIAVVTGQPHIARAVCVRDSEFVRIPAPAMNLIGGENPQVLLLLVQNIARRLHPDVATSGHSNLVTIGLVSANADTEMLPFAHALKRALQVVGPVLHVNRGKIAAAIGNPLESLPFYLYHALYRSKAVSWLARQEEHYRFVLLEADADDMGGMWSQLVVSQSDCILLVADRNSSSQIEPEEQHLLWDPRSAAAQANQASSSSSMLNDSIFAVGAHVELVLLHSKVGNEYPRPKNTKAWLDNRPFLRQHHHIRLGEEQDYDRLARHLSNRSIGLVLGGGGSRGLAHLGVLKALHNSGIPVDKIGGTSQGALMGASYAMTLSMKEMTQIVGKMSKRMGSIWGLLQDITLPMLALFSGGTFAKGLKETLGEDTDIEDMWIPYFCVTTNVSSADMEIHLRGSLRKYVQASMTVVGLLPPVFDKGCLLVDGGYVDNLPVDPMRQMGTQVIIAVDVENKDYGLENCSEYGLELSGWWLLWERLTSIFARFGLKKERRVPRYGAIVDALAYISHTRQLRNTKSRVDLYIRPPVEMYALLDYHLISEISSRAYTHAKRAIGEWKMKRDLIQQRGRMRRSGSSMGMLMQAVHEVEEESDEDEDTDNGNTTPIRTVVPEEEEKSIRDGFQADLDKKDSAAWPRLPRFNISRLIAKNARGPIALAKSLRRGAPC